MKNSIFNIDLKNQYSILNLLLLFRIYRKTLIIFGLIGGLLGFITWYFSSNYTSILKIQNKNYHNLVDSEIDGKFISIPPIFDLNSWINIQKKLPLLAADLQNKNLILDDNKNLFSLLSDLKWWQKNIEINFIYSSDDINKYSVLSKDSSLKQNLIQSIDIITKGNSSNDAISNGLTVADFLKKGAALIEIQDYFNRLDSFNKINALDLKIKLSKNYIEEKYIRGRIKNLENLRGVLYGGKNSNSLWYNNSNLDVKYLPIENQLIGEYNNLYKLIEENQKINTLLSNYEFLQPLITDINIQVNTNYDGILLSNNLINFIDNYKTGNANDYLLDKIKFELASINNRYSLNLVNTSPKILSKMYLVRYVIVGSFISIFIVFIIIIFIQYYTHLKKVNVLN